jgi:cation:H+ antiporter
MNAVAILLFVVGLGLLVAGAEALVRGASRLANLFGISPLVIGLTVVAYGTSAPELAVSVRAALVGQADLALGNVVGSNICNILLILGLAACVAPLAVDVQLVRSDVWVMIGVSIAALLLGIDGRLGRIDGVLLFAGAVVYTLRLIRQSRRLQAQHRPEDARAVAATPGTRAPRYVWLVNGGLVLLGLAMLTVGAKWLVDGAIAFARVLGVSELIIGLTIVAVGTSLPEIATSVIASLRGQRDIAVGNVVGSNIFNVLAVLGPAAALAPAGIHVPHTSLIFDMPVMIAASVACLPIFFTGYRIDRWEGALFLVYYAAYIVYLVLDATRSQTLAWYRFGVLWFALPLTIVTLAVVLVQNLRDRRRGAPAP